MAVNKKLAESTNKRRLEPPALATGSKVWYKPDPKPGHDKTDTCWTGPGTVLRREGKDFYVVKVKYGVKTEDVYVEKEYPLN